MATKKIRKSSVKPDLSTEFEQFKHGTVLFKGKKYKNKYYKEVYRENGTLMSTSWHKGNDLSLMSCNDTNLEGSFAEYYENGNLQIKGNKNKDKYYLETYSENGTLEERTSHRCGVEPFSTCSDQNREGPFESYYENGQIAEKGTIKNDEYHGLHKQYYENGQLWYEERCSNGKRNGNYVMFYPNGQVACRGNYCKGKRIGLHRSWDSDGNLVFRGRYVDDVPNGKEQSFDKEGKPLQGIIETHYEDGTPYFRGNFINGRADGLHKKWFRVGRTEMRHTLEIMYKNGKRDGEEVYTQISCKNIKIYKEGVLISEKNYKKRKGKWKLSNE